MTPRTRLYYYAAWAISLAGLIGSLYYSEIRHLTPCLLCWYQRILMYPLVAIIAVGLIKKDRNLPYYVLPLSLIGLGVAIFHYLLQMGIIPDDVAPCAEGISCASTYIEYFGFVTIPFLSMLGFAGISAAMWLSLKEHKLAEQRGTEKSMHVSRDVIEPNA